jgi:hypothetical protein
MEDNVVKAEPVAEDSAPETNEYIEYLGEEDNPHGTAFLTTHTIPRGDSVWGRLKVDKPTKDLTWTRDEFGPKIGQKGSRMLLDTEGLDPKLVQALAKVPGYKVVNE